MADAEGPRALRSLAVIMSMALEVRSDARAEMGS